MRNRFKLYGAFEKIEPQEDGTLVVSGVASSEAVDAAGETVKADAMKAAIPDYMAFGAVREMHQNIAAGVAIKCEVGDDNKTYFSAKVVDPTTVLKVNEGVLKGFSIGGKVTGRDPLDKNVITGIKLNEISLVDRPCNPEALVSLGKVEGADEEPTLGDLRKSMWSVQDFVGVLRSIGYMAQDAFNEAQWENDNSPVPAALRDWLAQGAEIFQTMAAEEIAELLATLPAPPAPPAPEVLAMAEKLAKGEMPEGLMKVGAKFSKASKEALADVHKAIQGCCDKMAALGYDKDEEDEENPEDDDAEKLAKLDAEKTEALTKVEALEADLKKAQTEADGLRKQAVDLQKALDAEKAKPEAPKGVKQVISKSQDTAPAGASESNQDLIEELEKAAKANDQKSFNLALTKAAMRGVTLPKL